MHAACCITFLFISFIIALYCDLDGRTIHSSPHYLSLPCTATATACFLCFGPFCLISPIPPCIPFLFFCLSIKIIYYHPPFTEVVYLKCQISFICCAANNLRVRDIIIHKNINVVESNIILDLKRSILYNLA